MSDDGRFDLEREERIADALRRPVRDVPLAPFAHVAARVPRRTPPVLAAVAAVAVLVLAVIIGGQLAAYRAEVAAPPTPTATATLAPRASTSGAPTATPPAAATASPAPTAHGTPIPMPNEVQLSAPGGDVVWALVAGTHLFRSTDRGDTWDERTLPAQPVNDEISFVDDREGWLLQTGSPATQCTSQAAAFWHTTDGAQTWTRIAQVVTAAPTGMGAQCKEALSFVDATHGFLSAWDQNHPPVIYRTADGGSTWSASRPLPDPPGFTTQAGGFTLRAGRVRAFGSTLLVEAGGNAGGSEREYVFTSTDGGATWRYLATLPQPNPAGFAFVTATRWLDIGDAAALRETTDGGTTWHAYASDYSQAAPVAPAVTFGDAQVGYATVRGAIQRTVDGGAHWTVLHTPGT